MSRQRKKIREIARYFSCVGRSNLPRASQVLKTKSVAVRQARRRRPYAAAITGADTPKFRKQSKHVLQRGKIKSQLPCLKVTNLQFQIIRIKILMLKWMIDGRVFKREIFSQNNFGKFDKINFQNLLAPDNDAKNKSRWGRSIILEIGFHVFLTPKGCLMKISVSY